MTLGELIDALKDCDQTTSCRFDFGYFVPTEIKSYRGDYSHLALAYTEDREPPQVSSVVVFLEAAIGKHHEGYKGGGCKASRESPVWVANWGQCPGTAVVAARESEGVVILDTKHIEY